MRKSMNNNNNNKLNIRKSEKFIFLTESANIFYFDYHLSLLQLNTTKLALYTHTNGAAWYFKCFLVYLKEPHYTGKYSKTD